MMGLIFLALFILAGTVWLLVRPWAPAGERRGERYHQLQLAPNSKHRALITPAKRGKGNKLQVSDTESRTPDERHAAMT